jgi:hypothetical protein
VKLMGNEYLMTPDEVQLWAARHAQVEPPQHSKKPSLIVRLRVRLAQALRELPASAAVRRVTGVREGDRGAV